MYSILLSIQPIFLCSPLVFKYIYQFLLRLSANDLYLEWTLINLQQGKKIRGAKNYITKNFIRVEDLYIDDSSQ